MKGFETKRQLFHLFLGIAIVVLLFFNIIGKWQIFVLIILGIITSLLSKKYKIPVIYWLLKNFEREEELKKFHGKGTIFYFIGTFLVLSFFPKDIALASILILAFGDSISTMLGIRFKKIKNPLSDKKFSEGFIAGVLAAFLASLIFLSWYEALAASFLAMAAESIEIKLGLEKVDDNIIIPIVAGFTISIIRLFV